jgi:hypothetical protein
LRVLAIAVLVALPFAFLAACATESGKTPDCVSDVTANGVTPVDKGCTGYAVCRDSITGKDADPVTCCKTADGKPYVGDQLAFCLLSYGIGEPTSASSGAGSSSSAGSSTSSGSSTGTGG